MNATNENKQTLYAVEINNLEINIYSASDISALFLDEMKPICIFDGYKTFSSNTSFIYASVWKNYFHSKSFDIWLKKDQESLAKATIPLQNLLGENQTHSIFLYDLKDESKIVGRVNFNCTMEKLE